ncbi:hypothetical protein [uncultured Methanolobus sp.]|uniref:hypothetical protein n=1 Tax=uncultured Methanolobus sp. TaxID=218300 RepID=UPI002AAAFDE3|nr:hypothetical protein [uncultured Methanolobus sp.]
MTPEKTEKSNTPEGHSTGGLPTREEYEKWAPVVLRENSELIEALRTGYVIEDRVFHVGKEYLLSENELSWLNQKLIERHCLPIGYEEYRNTRIRY